MIDNYSYASNNTDRPGRARPTPRHGGAAGRRHADHPEARRRLYQRQHQTGYCQVKWNSRVLEAKSVIGRT